jgi:hypothetical protein
MEFVCEPQYQSRKSCVKILKTVINYMSSDCVKSIDWMMELMKTSGDISNIFQ